MSEVSKFKLNLAIDPVYIVLILLAVGALTFFVYRYTIPDVSKIFKSILILLRTLALFAIILALLEPVLSIDRTVEHQKKNFVFIDNSLSIIAPDSAGAINKIKETLKTIDSKSNNVDYFSFGEKIEKIPFENIDSLKFYERSTNFSLITDTINTYKNILSSSLIISDGIITSGKNPVFDIEKLGVNIFTIGVGQTEKEKDIQMGKVLFNEYLYRGKTSIFKLNILNTGFENKTIAVSMSEDNNLFSQKTIRLNKSGINTVEFEYTPETAGEKMISFNVTAFTEEQSKENNKKIIFANVLESRVNIFTIAGSPSTDLTFILRALEEDKNFNIHKVVEIGGGAIIGRDYLRDIRDSADVIILSGFPTSNSDKKIIADLMNTLENKNIPLFAVINRADILTGELNRISSFPIKFRSKSKGQYSTQQFSTHFGDIVSSFSTGAQIDDWRELPPVSVFKFDYDILPGSKILIDGIEDKTKEKVPLLTSRNVSGQKSLILNALNIWKWKLQTAVKGSQLYDELIVNLVKWLYTNDDLKKFRVLPDKKVYSPGETVALSANLYDESLNPIEDADISVNFKTSENEFSLFMLPVGNGIYEADFNPEFPGEFSFDASASLDGIEIGKTAGKISVGEIEIEKVNLIMDKQLLVSLADATGADYSYIESPDELLNKFLSADNEEPTVIHNKTEIKLWSHELLLIIIILFFAAEWFLRKRAGML